MPKRITIAPHLSIEELQARFRQAKTTTQAHHYQIIWLLAGGQTTAEVMTVTGYSRGWIYELVWGYNHLGPESLGDQRCQNTDRDPLLNDVEQAQLWQVLQQPPPDGGLWNGRKVADWMSELKGYKVSRQRGWEYLKSMKFRLRVPRPEHKESDLLEPEEWKKKSASVRLENQEGEPRKRRRSLVNG
jgi:transposase